MKKFIYTSELSVGDKIWRGNAQPTDEKSFEFKYNDPTKYIIGSKVNKENFSFDTKLLEEFPEYNVGWETIITNTGLTCFYTENQDTNNFVIYDMFDKENIELSNIKPDISMLLQYNFVDQPLNVRKVFFKEAVFVAEKFYKYNEQYFSFINADSATLTEGGINTFSNISYEYKPLFVFRVYNFDSSPKENAIIKINGNIPATKHSNGIYFIDLSSTDPNDNNGLVSISLGNCGDGYLEVI